MNSDWIDFCTTVKKQLSAISSPGIRPAESFLTFLHEPAFENPTLLQLFWKNDLVNWHMAIWDRAADSLKFEPIENLKYIGKEICPTILKFTGTDKPHSIKAITEAIIGLSIPPRITPLEGFILDGDYYMLTIGVDDQQTTYTWHMAPDEWQGLVDLVVLLLHFQKNLSSQSVSLETE